MLICNAASWYFFVLGVSGNSGVLSEKRLNLGVFSREKAVLAGTRGKKKRPGFIVLVGCCFSGNLQTGNVPGYFWVRDRGSSEILRFFGVLGFDWVEVENRICCLGSLLFSGKPCAGCVLARYFGFEIEVLPKPFQFSLVFWVWIGRKKRTKMYHFCIVCGFGNHNQLCLVVSCPWSRFLRNSWFSVYFSKIEDNQMCHSYIICCFGNHLFFTNSLGSRFLTQHCFCAQLLRLAVSCSWSRFFRNGWLFVYISEIEKDNQMCRFYTVCCFGNNLFSFSFLRSRFLTQHCLCAQLLCLVVSCSRLRLSETGGVWLMFVWNRCLEDELFLTHASLCERFLLIAEFGSENIFIVISAVPSEVR